LTPVQERLAAIPQAGTQLQGTVYPLRYPDPVSGDVRLPGLDRPSVFVRLAREDGPVVKRRHHPPELASFNPPAAAIERDHSIHVGTSADPSIRIQPPTRQQKPPVPIKDLELQPCLLEIATSSRELVAYPAVPHHHVYRYRFSECQTHR
jgi:hypothetical protein